MALAKDAAFQAEKNMLNQPLVLRPCSKSQVAQRQHRIMATTFSIMIQFISGTLHTCSLSHQAPFCWEAFNQVCNLERHTQAHLTQPFLVGIHKLDNVVLLVLLKLVVCKQHTIVGNLFDAQDLVTHGVQSQVQIVTA